MINLLSMRKALYLTALSVGLAFIFNYLFFEKVPGISVGLFTMLLVGTVAWFGWYHHVSLRKHWWLVVLIAFFAVMPSIRDNLFLNFLNLCATLGLLLVLAHELTGTPAIMLKLRDYLLLVTLVPLRMLQRAVFTVGLIGQIHSQVKQRDVWLQIVMGTVLALPILIISAVLFSQADLVFAQFVQSFVNIHLPERTAQYLVLLLFAFVAALSWLAYIFFPKPETKSAQEQSPLTNQPDRSIQMMVFLGLIAALFLVFIVFQITYLFGGETNITQAGFTYAEYARRGFWELLAVAILSLVVLFAAEKHAGIETKRNANFLIPALFLIVEVGVIMVSAFKRLSLYIEAYGLTTLRFYVAGFIILLGLLFIILAIKFIYAKREQFFAFGILLSVIAFLMALNLVNPDAFIAKANLERYHQTGKLDVLYLAGLSADAEPWKLALSKQVSGDDQELVRLTLQAEKDYLEKVSSHWQSANLSRARAWQLLQNF